MKCEKFFVCFLFEINSKTPKMGPNFSGLVTDGTFSETDFYRPGTKHKKGAELVFTFGLKLEERGNLPINFWSTFSTVFAANTFHRSMIFKKYTQFTTLFAQLAHFTKFARFILFAQLTRFLVHLICSEFAHLAQRRPSSHQSWKEL